MTTEVPGGQGALRSRPASLKLGHQTPHFQEGLSFKPHGPEACPRLGCLLLLIRGS